MNSSFPIVGRMVITALLLSLALPGLAVPSKFQRGLTISDPARTAPGYVLFDGPDGNLYLIDQNGTLVNRWVSPVPNKDLGHARALDNGNVLALVPAVPDVIVEMDLAGNVVWQYIEAGGRKLHHDQFRMANGNTLITCSHQVFNSEISEKRLTDDCVIEVSPEGQIVWEWRALDHFEEFDLPQDARDLVFERGGDWSHSNSGVEIPPNSLGDARFKAGNIMISYRHINAVVVVDRETSELVWRTDNLTIGQHYAYILPEDVPGAGNLLVFDNGFNDRNYNIGDPVVRNYSRILEFDPVNQALRYEYNATKSGRPAWWFWSHFISSAQRLPNGNTLINEGSLGRIFEVTTSGKIVWEFVNPLIGNANGTPTTDIYRAEKVPLEWLSGRGQQ